MCIDLKFSFCFLLFLIILNVVGADSSSSSSSDSEVRSLLEFKKGIRDDPLGKIFNSWNRSSSQLSSNGCPLSWYGVVCDEVNGYVSSIVLEDLGLVGELKFHTLTGLKMLKNLSLSGNYFSGRFVPAMGAMSSLEYLDLSRNLFYGPIPGKINDLYNLHYLNLSSNRFNSGFPSIINLNQLRALDLHMNTLWGDVSDLFSELRNVEYVDLSYNKFYGGLSMDSDKISNLANTIKHLNLRHNRLNGEFLSEDSIKLFRNLEVLDVGDNEIRGEVPSFGSLPAFRILRAGNNQLFGAMPEEIFVGTVPLEEVDLSHNGFSGSIHSINSTSLKVLNLSSNALSGPLPSTLGVSIVIDLSRNQISGDISIMQNWGNTLEVLDLSSNELSGSFQNLSSQFGGLITIRISNNSLVGDLPLALGSSLRLSEVDLSLNLLTGPIPSIFIHSMTLAKVNLSGNQFTGAIPIPGSHTTELLVLPSAPQLESLDLSSNSLSGSLSSNIGNMGRLKLLNLGNNSLSDRIPGELSKLSVLEYLDLSNNKFEGKIPDQLTPSLKIFNVSSNDLSGIVPENLRGFPISSFRPGNPLLILPGEIPSPDHGPGGIISGNKRHSSKASIKVAIIVASVGSALMIAFVFLAYYRTHLHEHRSTGFGHQNTGRDVKLGVFTRPSIFKFPRSTPPPTSLSFSNDQLLTSGPLHPIPEERGGGSESGNPGVPGSSGWKSSPGSPLSSPPNLLGEQPTMLTVDSPDRLVGELFFLDTSLVFTAEELSRAPAEVLGRSSHGTLYKATLDSGHMLTVKWLRADLVKHKKKFAGEAKKLGSIRHPNVVSLRAYYWGPMEQERLILADYVLGDSLSLHLYENTPRRYSRLSFDQRLKIAVDVTRCLSFLHDRDLPHGNLKPTNILLTGPDLTARLTDYGLYRLMTPAGTAEQLLNLGALGYGAPELASAAKPLPSFKADVYALGVIFMELLTRKSAGDIISGQPGAVDLTDWVRLCAHEGRGMDCFDRDIAGGEEPSKAMDDLLAEKIYCEEKVCKEVENDKPAPNGEFERA
ncbi:Leucine-rich receptor-like protein kinase family protein [Thalictrum thalictroides]|uniref:Leucine-rich receptor-like protein kinase family protein n=1 Tax=Thalictrum thalictroides TaxID=46969 RepID=A0A7J6X2X7_THATH|nr:Leucine-rich receptor-like protein kinase family protein [Thalictrum thalictroides]